MHLTDEAIKEFEALWREDHSNEPLSRVEIMDAAERILCAVKTIFKPIPTEDEDYFKALLRENTARATAVELSTPNTGRIG